MKTIQDITIAAITPPLPEFDFVYSLQEFGALLRLSQIISNALAALSSSTCLIPLTETSGKLIIPVLISSFLHSIIVSN